jgi:hypothetical protein
MIPILSDIHRSSSLIKSTKLDTENGGDDPQSLPSILEILPFPFVQSESSIKEGHRLLPLDGIDT